MSADAWSQCPKCGEQSLREDWEIGNNEGDFTVEYHASCSPRHRVKVADCDFEFNYSYITSMLS